MLHSERMLSVLVLQEMNNELKRQERVLDAVTDHTDRSAYELQNVSQQAKKDFQSPAWCVQGLQSIIPRTRSISSV